MGKLHPNFIAGIGGSAGSLNAYKALLDALPSNTGMAFVIVSHILPTFHSLLAEIVSGHTKMKVIEASTMMPVQANHIYVCPLHWRPSVPLLSNRIEFLPYPETQFQP